MMRIHYETKHKKEMEKTVFKIPCYLRTLSLIFNNFSLHIPAFSLLSVLGNLENSKKALPEEKPLL